jgi:aryl-alcohol dehydrogenase-like predicted oxidoreductase
VVLGRSGVTASFLAQGTGTQGWARASDQSRLGQAAFARLLHHGLDSGISFLDLADLYGTHPMARSALTGVPRDRYTVLTKIWPRAESWNRPSGGARIEIDRFRKELDLETIDVCLIHSVSDERWPSQYERMVDELSALKAAGTVRAVGVSCHDLGALRTAADHPWVDLIAARINHRGGRAFSMDGDVESVSEVLRRARSRGKAVLGMKVFGAGKLTGPEERDASLRHVIGGGLVDAVTIGMMSGAQVDDSIARIGRALNAG